MSADDDVLVRIRTFVDSWRNADAGLRARFRERPVIITPVIFDLAVERLPDEYGVLLTEMRQDGALHTNDHPRDLQRRFDRPMRYVNRHERRRR